MLWKNTTPTIEDHLDILTKEVKDMDIIVEEKLAVQST